MTVPRSITGTLKSIAQSAFAASSHYDRYRPSFPAKPVQALLTGLQVSGVRGARIVDLGAGTGKFTEVLARREEGFDIVAVEPHDDMRRQLEQKKLRGVDVVKGFATAMPVDDHSVDAVIASQSFHWFADESTLQEVHRVLRPGHFFGMIWNIEDYNSPREWTPTTPYEAKLKDLIWSLSDSESRFRHGKWREVFDRQGQKSVSADSDIADSDRRLFSYPIEEGAVPFTASLPKDDVWNRMRSLSHIANSDAEEQKRLRDRVYEILSDKDAVNDEGLVDIHGNTFIAWTQAV